MCSLLSVTSFHALAGGLRLVLGPQSPPRRICFCDMLTRIEQSIIRGLVLALVEGCSVMTDGARVQDPMRVSALCAKLPSARRSSS